MLAQHTKSFRMYILILFTRIHSPHTNSNFFNGFLSQFGKAGATGLHLSRGERSLLDAFQVAAESVLEEDVGVLIPLYAFYPSIEEFMDTAVKRTVVNG